jgi:hypothetical protein
VVLRSCKIDLYFSLLRRFIAGSTETVDFSIEALSQESMVENAYNVSLGLLNAFKELNREASPEWAVNHPDALFRLGLFADSLLQACKKGGDVDLVHKYEDWADTCVSSLLQLLKCGYPNSADHFPRVLQLALEYQKAGQRFQLLAPEIPLHLILKWIPQVVAMLVTPGGQILSNFCSKVIQMTRLPRSIHKPFASR